VCDLTETFGLAQPTISHHPRVLREAGVPGFRGTIARRRRRGDSGWKRRLVEGRARLSSLRIEEI
jgi:hypothetical protein